MMRTQAQRFTPDGTKAGGADVLGWSDEPIRRALGDPDPPHPNRRDTLPAMSEKNVEIVTRSFEHFERTGEPLLDALDPEVEVPGKRRRGQEA
jgi:hypothetical protein